MEQKAVIRHNYATHVCVDAYENKIFEGRLQSAAWDGDEHFTSLMDFFRKMERLLDQTLPPQAFNTMRSFGDASAQAPHYEPTAARVPGKLATFAVRILFRQNASWQGSVLWMEGGQEESFRSALELALLMDSALQKLRPL